MQRRGDQIFLLPFVQSRDAGGGSRRPGPSRVQKLVLRAERELQAVSNLVPAALILRFLLTPDHGLQVGIAREFRSQLLRRERIQLFNADELCIPGVRRARYRRAR